MNSYSLSLQPWTLLIANRNTIKETPFSEIEKVVARLLGASVSSVERIYGGRNNRLYRVTCDDSENYVAKFYPKVEANERDRLHAEFVSMEFLWKHGLHSVPRPVALDTTLGCAIYEHVDGQDIPPASITESDIDQAVRCLVRIKELCGSEGSAQLPTAAEACSSVGEVVGNIDGRLERLRSMPDEEDHYRELHAFLEREYSPAFTEISHWCELTLNGWGVSTDLKLATSQRTLSPSDFGFHNALRRPTGEIVFLDFEYFGWDDPAKMISDFLHHPAMNLTESLKQRFVDNILRGFHEYENLVRRLAVVYPLFGLKWCLIMLNEFLPEKLSRREFANGTPVDLGEIQSIQLEKAKALLDRVKREYSQFQYAG